MKLSKKFKLFTSFFLIGVAITLIASIGYGAWVFNDTKSAGDDASIDANDVSVDDIAENYYFASDLSSKNYYNVYFFAQPQISYYVYHYGYTPLQAYKYFCDKFYDDSSTNNKVEGGTTSGYSIYSRYYYGYWSDASNTCDGTATGYKVIKNAYKRVSTSQFQSLGNLICGMGDGHIDNPSAHYDGYGLYNLGFTSNNETASEKGYKAYPQFEQFNTNKLLSTYTISSDSHNIYLYPIYSSGKDYDSSAAVPDVKMRERVNDSGNYRDKHYLSRSNYTISGLGNDDLDYYYSLSNMLVSSDTGSLGSQDSYYNSGFDYSIAVDGDRRLYYSDGSFESQKWSGNWSVSKTIDISSYSPGTYNLYLYFNESNTEAGLNSANKKVKTYFQNNFEIYKSGSQNPSAIDDLTVSGSSYRVYASLLYFVEKVSDFRFVGETTGSLSYDTSNGTVIPFQQNTDLDGNSYIYYTNEVILPSQKYTDFGINFGTVLDDGSSIVKIDSSATDTAYPCYQPGATNSDKTQYTDPSGNLVYYTNDKINGTSNTTLDNPEKIQTFKVSAPGVYRFRISVTYKNGVPSDIQLSAAYLRGVFVELFSANPTGTINNSSGNSTGYVDHSAYEYRLNDYYDAKIYSSSKFTKTGTTTTYSLSDIVPTNAYLKDHVLGDIIKIDPNCVVNGHDKINCFYVNGTWSNSFSLNKNYIFYSSTGSIN